ncbi:MAG: BMP family ABC transporter substrate-binding protein [Betaproteobacteria bacterium]|nr:BMP family ABC transporter substrate-binding protein [Betaproteobacteria bacterium]
MKKLLLVILALLAGSVFAQDKPLTVGVIYIGTANDYGYNRAMKDGVEAMKKALPAVSVLEAENVPETAESERIMSAMISKGAKLIMATSFGHQEFANSLARSNPGVTFVHAGGWMIRDNFGTFFGATQTAWYALGVAAGHMSKAGKAGFVAGVPIGYVVGNINAFQLGARSVNPKFVTRVVVTGGWSDKVKEAAAANALIDQGADVLTMHVDSPATVIQIAENRGIYSIGFQSVEARALAPKGWITGLGFNWAPYMTRTAQEVMAGTFKGKMVREGLKEQMLVLAPFGDAVPQPVRDAVNATAAKIADGFTPFKGPIKDNTGAYALREGEAMTNADMGKFDWYAEGIVGRVR